MKEEDAKKRIEQDAEPRLLGLHLVPIPVQSEEDKRREVCDSTMNCEESSCHQSDQTVQLSTQLLRTCRQVNLDAALLPYSTNTFNFSGGIHQDALCDAFVQKLGLKQRQAIRSAIMNVSSLECAQKIPDLLPGIKHLWMRFWLRGFWRWDLEEDFARVKLPSLVGAAVQMGSRLGKTAPYWLDKEILSLELALLDNKERGDLEVCKRALRARSSKGSRWEMLTYAPVDAPLAPLDQDD
jgi:hypothetical protein